MAAFDAVHAAVECGIEIQRDIERFNRSREEALLVRIGIHAGGPVEDRNDLFGRTAQLAARIRSARAGWRCDDLPERARRAPALGRAT